MDRVKNGGRCAELRDGDVLTLHLVTTEFPPMIGGISTWSRAVADALHAQGQSVVVHVRRSSEIPIETPYPVIRMWGRSWRRWQGLWAAASVLPRLRPNDRVLCATWPLAQHFVGRGFPVGISAHGSDLSRPPPFAGREEILRKATAFLPVSRFLGEMAGVPYTVLPYPIAKAARVRRGENLLCVARLTALKGVDRVLRLGARWGWPVVVVGEGSERPFLEALAKDLQVNATFLGALPAEKIPWEGSRALALLSRTAPDGSGAEGLGLVLLEAAARGIPTLGTPVGGIPEAAQHLLADLDRAEVPMFGSEESIESWLLAKHGPHLTVKVLNRSLAPVETGV